MFVMHVRLCVWQRSIDIPGVGSYREFLIGGTFALTVVTFGANFTGAGLADDMTEGNHQPVPLAPHVTLRQCVVRPHG